MDGEIWRERYIERDMERGMEREIWRERHGERERERERERDNDREVESTQEWIHNAMYWMSGVTSHRQPEAQVRGFPPTNVGVRHRCLEEWNYTVSRELAQESNGDEQPLGPPDWKLQNRSMHVRAGIVCMGRLLKTPLLRSLQIPLFQQISDRGAVC